MKILYFVFLIIFTFQSNSFAFDEEKITYKFNEKFRHIEIGLTELFEKLFLNDDTFKSDVEYKSQNTDILMKEIFNDLNNLINHQTGSLVTEGQGSSDFYDSLWLERKNLINEAYANAKIKNFGICYPYNENSYGNCKGPELLKNRDGSIIDNSTKQTIKKLLTTNYIKYKEYLCIEESIEYNSCDNPSEEFLEQVSQKYNEMVKDFKSFEVLIESQYYNTLKFFPIYELKNFVRIKTEEFNSMLENKIQCLEDEIYFEKLCYKKIMIGDTYFFAQIHDKALKEGRDSFLFIDGKEYKVNKNSAHAPFLEERYNDKTQKWENNLNEILIKYHDWWLMNDSCTFKFTKSDDNINYESYPIGNNYLTPIPEYEISKELKSIKDLPNNLVNIKIINALENFSTDSSEPIELNFHSKEIKYLPLFEPKRLTIRPDISKPELVLEGGDLYFGETQGVYMIHKLDDTGVIRVIHEFISSTRTNLYVIEYDFKNNNGILTYTKQTNRQLRDGNYSERSFEFEIVYDKQKDNISNQNINKCYTELN